MDWKRTRLIAVAAVIGVMSSGLRAEALTAELARKCRDLAIKAHPPKPAGTNPYAEAEREFFNACVAKNGSMPDPDEQKQPPAGSK
jgi:hypothetical protein